MALLTCLTMGTAVVGRVDGATTEKELSAKQMLDSANKAMKALKSVTITYLEHWSGQNAPAPKDQNHWVKAPASEAKEGSGVAACTRDFTSFGVATKGQPRPTSSTPAAPATESGIPN
ncbi:hypothetical protein [Streptomyces asiaticus]